VAKKKVLISTCDSCGFEEVTNIPDKTKRAEFVLPNGWVHVRVDDRHKSILASDLCPKCAVPIRDIAGRSNNRKKNKH
jgi:hypothetical protein